MGGSMRAGGRAEDGTGPGSRSRGRAGGVLVAAGRSTRMRSPDPASGAPRKPWIELAGRSLLEHACRALAASPRLEALVLVVHSDDLERAGTLARAGTLPKVLRVVEGGRERVDSVTRGLEALPDSLSLVAVHDAARPLVRPEDVTRAIEAAEASGAALLAEPVADTLKRSEDGSRATSTVEREGLWKAQTPQVFELARLKELLARARAEGFVPTDEASLWERYVGPVSLVEGPGSNFKITRPDDLELARAVLAARAAEAGA